MPKTADAVRAAVNRERVRNMKSVCLYCRNGSVVEYAEFAGGIRAWVHGHAICAAGPIRERAAKYGAQRDARTAIQKNA